MAHRLYNVVTASDSYKVTHPAQYPEDCTRVYSHGMARSLPPEWDNEIVWYGLQYHLMEYFEGVQLTKEMILGAEQEWAEHFGRPGYFNTAGWMDILRCYRGKLPVVIRSLPEGTVIPKRVMPFDIENTDAKHAWLTNWLETMLSHVWYPTAVATQSRLEAKIMRAALEKTGTVESWPYKLHDFGFRGTSCFEEAIIGSASHLVTWMGTDTYPGCRMARHYYSAKGMPGASIPASEHSTVTINGEEGELEFFRKMLTIYPPDQVVACVSDSYDIIRAIKEYWGGELKDLILARQAPLVIRPDSSNKPVPEAIIDYLEAAAEVFGDKPNSKGYRVLPDQVRLIQGDGIDYASFKASVDAMVREGWSLDNMAFGSGGGLLRKVNRDTIGWAIKCSFGAGWSSEGGGWAREVYKAPAGMKMKHSARGLLKTVMTPEGVWATCKRDQHPELKDQMVEVFRDGEITKKWQWEKVCQRAAEGV